MTSTCAIFLEVLPGKFGKSSEIIISAIVLILRPNSNLYNVFKDLSMKLRECEFQSLNEQQIKQINMYLICPQGLTVYQR